MEEKEVNEVEVEMGEEEVVDEEVDVKEEKEELMVEVEV